MKQSILILITLCTTAGCAGQTQKFQSSILGKWEYLGSDIPEHYLTFKENGECVTRYFYGDETHYDETVEKYSVDGKTIKFSDNNHSAVEFEYELSGDSLIIKNRVYKETKLFKDRTKTLIYMDAIYGRPEYPSNTADPGVVINGVTWATRNVAAPGTFAGKPEDAGMFYQWNRKKAWSAEGDTVENWDSSIPEGTEWEKANDPSPSGWRVPTREEIQSLLDTAKVNSEWIIQNEIKGYKFTDKTTGNNLFLPAAGYRYLEDGVFKNNIFFNGGACGWYWSSTPDSAESAYSLFFYSGYTDISNGYRNNGFSIRCVAN